MKVPREALYFLADKVRELDTEFEVHKMAFAAFKEIFPEYAERLDASLAASRQSSVLQEKLRLKYDAIREMIDRLPLDELTPEEVQTIMKEMQSKWIN